MPHPFLRPMPEPMVRRVRERILEIRPGEARVLAEVLQGQTSIEMGAAMGISPRTVEVHIQRILTLLGCSRIQLVRILSHELAGDTELMQGLEELADWYDPRKGPRPQPD
jgi:DNA-binding CsgD family transcriptional regulator